MKPNNQKSEICLFKPFISNIEYSLIYIFTNIWVREISVKAINIAAGTDTTPTMTKNTKYHILYQNNNMLLH